MVIDRTGPSVLVLLASYNGGRFISDQIATIRGQQGVRASILVRDDGSDDDTKDVLHQLALSEPSLRILDDRKPSTGSAALNFLHMISTADFGDAEYIALADQDDLWLPQKLARATQRLEHAGAEGYSSDLTAFDDEGRRSQWTIEKHDRQTRFDHLFQGGSAGCTYVMTRRAAEALRVWIDGIEYPNDIGISHDWLIYAFFRASGLEWICDDRAFILYRQHSGNVYGSRRGLVDIRQRLTLLRDDWYRQHILWLARQLPLRSQEQAIIRRVERLNIWDRIWLACRAGSLRRRSSDAAKLRLALLLGFF